MFRSSHNEAMNMSQDAVSTILAQYHRALPGLDLTALGLAKRAARLVAHLEQVGHLVLVDKGLDAGEFDVLSTLFRSGPPFTLTPTGLFRDLFISSSGMTKRLDKLETRGLIRRSPSPDDRRSLLVTLTLSGQDLAIDAVRAHARAFSKALRSGPGEASAIEEDLIRASADLAAVLARLL
jgi:DNA-binding MarR family transcriptional regulator